MDEDKNELVLEAATAIVAAYVSENEVSKDDIGSLIETVGEAVRKIVNPQDPEEEEEVHEPAVSVRKSLANPDHIISMIDGQPYKMLTRHLSTNGLTPDEYRKRYNLPADYPMTAPNYSERRRQLAKEIGLGRKPGQKPNKKK